MSSYSCVIPVNWALLWERLLPAWLSVLSGRLEASAFYATYVPAGDEYGDLLEEHYAAPTDYLSLFDKPLHPPYLRLKLHSSGNCSSFLQVADSVASPYLLEVAIKQTAAVNLTGCDQYAEDPLASTDTRCGRVQVAGTKNLYSFLESAFEVRWEPQTHRYSYSRRHVEAAPRLHDLLEALFLYQHVIPGAWFPAESPTWPGYDDLSFAGYLSPTQVRALHEELTSWDHSSPVEDDLFLLFTDRVQRAAASGLGLLTIHAGL